MVEVGVGAGEDTAGVPDPVAAGDAGPEGEAPDDRAGAAGASG